MIENPGKPSFSVSGKSFFPGKTLVIAEIGTSHSGDRDKARELIVAARESGADCAKFQAVIADEIIRPETGVVHLPNGPTRLYDTFKSLERDTSFYSFLKDETERQGMIFLCTPFGLDSAKMLGSLGVAAIKVASPELNHTPLLREIASSAIPTILSSGVSMLADIEYALSFFHGIPAALLHCVTSYPAPEDEYNLSILEHLSVLFGIPVGVSDHSLDPVLIPSLSVLCGGSLVEKHFALSNSGHGLDDPVALEPHAFKKMTDSIRKAEKSEFHDGIYRLACEYGEKKIRACLGTGGKKLSASESANYGRTNRSVHATRLIEKGERLTKENTCIVRTEKILRPGIEPRYLPIALGRIAAGEIPSGEGIRWDDIGGF